EIDGVVAGKWALSVATVEYVTLEDVLLDVEGPVDGTSLVAVRTGTIRGRVVGPDGAPLADARVEQSTDQPDWMAALAREVETARTRTGEDGTFQLIGVRPGKVVLSATSDELSPAETDALDLDPGATLEDVELQLRNGGAIEGIVFDEDGSPASGRVVQVQSATLSVMRPVSTGDDGTFEVRGLPAGSYQLVAMDPSTDMASDMDASGFAAMMDSIDIATAEVVEGETVIVYIGAPPADPVDVSGTVEQSGEPYAGAMVTWMPASKAMYERLKMTTTDADGNYALTLDEPGDYVVSVARMGGATGQQQTVEFSESIPDDTTEFERDFEVPGGTLAGRVVGPDDAPMPGARLTVMSVGSVRTDRMLGGSYAEIVTNADGTFEVSGLRAGSYQVAAGGGTGFGASASASARTVVGDFELSENGRIDGIEVRLSEPGAVAVRVVDATGAGVPGATVFLRDEQGRHTELFSLVVTDRSGVAHCTGLAPGRYTVAARTPTDASNESLPVDVRPGEKAEAEVLLGPGATIVAVLRSKGDAAIPAGSIQVLDSAGRDVTRRIGLTDMQSLYSEAAFSTTERRIGPVPPGRYKVLASTADGRSAKRYVTIDEGGERRVSLVLR
ncbi:MAG: carboxypeptidase regulatory-like domain-containing protein, partial [Planctomycetota bacterium]